MDTTAGQVGTGEAVRDGEGAAGVSCVRCGYDLRGLPATGVCPECGLGVARSMGDRERLEECPPAWVGRVAFGVGLLAVSMAWMLVAPIFMWGWTPRAVLPMPGWFRSPSSWLGTASVVRNLGLVIQLAGVWLVTSREPRGKGGRRGWVWLWRVCTILAIAAGAMEAYRLWNGTSYSSLRYYRWFNPQRCLALAGPALWAAFAICPAVGFWHLKWLAGRIGRPKLAEYAGIVGAGLSALLMVGVVIGFERAHQMVNYYAYYAQASEDVQWAAVVVPLAAGAVVYAWRKLRGRRPCGWGYVWAGLLWVAACGWGEAQVRTDYTRRLWKTVLVVAVPMATWAVFYLWGLFLLVRMAVKFRRAGRDAAAAWRAADAAG